MEVWEFRNITKYKIKGWKIWKIFIKERASSECNSNWYKYFQTHYKM